MAFHQLQGPLTRQPLTKSWLLLFDIFGHGPKSKPRCVTTSIVEGNAGRRKQIRGRSIHRRSMDKASEARGQSGQTLHHFPFILKNFPKKKKVENDDPWGQSPVNSSVPRLIKAPRQGCTCTSILVGWARCVPFHFRSPSCFLCEEITRTVTQKKKTNFSLRPTAEQADGVAADARRTLLAGEADR